MFKRQLILASSALSIFAATILSISAPLNVVSAKLNSVKNPEAEIARQKTVDYFSSQKNSLIDKNIETITSDSESNYKNERLLIDTTGSTVNEKILFLQQYLNLMDKFTKLDINELKIQLNLKLVNENAFKQIKEKLLKYVNENPNIEYAKNLILSLTANKIEINKSYSRAVRESKDNLETILLFLGIIGGILSIASIAALFTAFFSWLSIPLGILSSQFAVLSIILGSVSKYSPHLNIDKYDTLGKWLTLEIN
ncbi:hypothetical protein EI74_0283 [Mycoplasma testudineum]|uniref:Uncharacterized protein n=1 Tax=Mycoplasma testudineum TaxID=244584 RepID=A0A4R6IHC0_9MOLU|nr:hypothetical protein [Mycoplasma testudineum]OYD26907.1 hypothetical protein CG473_01025 [Mycoplasma testudineum]TDO20455.1 hypothetical protein EI74_0283 [Mycoplasma testudineum]